MNGDHLLNFDPDVNIQLLNNNLDVYNCKYTSAENFKNIAKTFNENGLSIVSFNIRSFEKNNEEFLAYLTNCNHIFDIIILTETWGKDETHTLLHIPGYQSIHNNRKEKRGGGVSIFIKDSFKFMPITTLDISEEALETVAAKIYSPNSPKSTNVMGVYRPPRGNINDATNNLKDIITNNQFHRDNTIIAGDFNICLMNEDYSPQISNFTNMMREFFFRPLITRPTRFTENSATIIDHIWTNYAIDIDSYIFYCDITDHCPIYCRLNIPFQQDKKNN